jgi:hypothetical protein
MVEDSLQSTFRPETSHSYDACLARLAHAVEQHDDANLDEVASLIGQLAAVIEL